MWPSNQKSYLKISSKTNGLEDEFCHYQAIFSNPKMGYWKQIGYFVV
jgi:hypothetical protein